MYSQVQQWRRLCKNPMLSSLRGLLFSSSPSAFLLQLKNQYPQVFVRHFGVYSNKGIESSKELLSLAEVEKVLNDVGADDIKVISAPNRCEFTDHMVIATGRSPWHVRNISQALIYKVKQKQKGANRMLLPTVVGQEGGKWIAIDSGSLIVHAVDEKARAYYNFEGLWTKDNSDTDQSQDLEKAFVKVRRKNNSKKSPPRQT